MNLIGFKLQHSSVMMLVYARSFSSCIVMVTGGGGDPVGVDEQWSSFTSGADGQMLI